MGREQERSRVDRAFNQQFDSQRNGFSGDLRE